MIHFIQQNNEDHTKLPGCHFLATICNLLICQRYPIQHRYSKTLKIQQEGKKEEREEDHLLCVEMRGSAISPSGR